MSRMNMLIGSLLLTTTAVADVALPSHEGADEQTIQHHLNLSMTLFPEETGVEMEQAWMETPCGCGCGQVWADCCCNNIMNQLGVNHEKKN